MKYNKNILRLESQKLVPFSKSEMFYKPSFPLVESYSDISVIEELTGLRNGLERNAEIRTYHFKAGKT